MTNILFENIIVGQWVAVSSLSEITLLRLESLLLPFLIRSNSYFFDLYVVFLLRHVYRSTEQHESLV